MYLFELASEPWWPFVVVGCSVLFIIFAIAVLRLHAMLALVLAGVVAGLLTAKTTWSIPGKDGQPKEYSAFEGIIELVSKGLGDTARDIAISIALASIIGMCLMHSGAAEKVVRRFLGVFGVNRAGWALLGATYILSIPIFFDTMFMLMVPLAKTLARRTGRDYTLYAMCVACGGVITHSLTIPHPGPLAMIDDLKLDPGISLVAGLSSGVLVAIFGYFVCAAINRWMPIQPVDDVDNRNDDPGRDYHNVPDSELPSLFTSLLPVLLPIFLISLSSFALIIEGGAKASPRVPWSGAIYDLFGKDAFDHLQTYVKFIGNKNVALFVGTFIALWLVIKQCKFSLAEIERRVSGPLETAGMIILITSAGGAFGGMLRASGIGDAVVYYTKGGQVNLLLLAWFMASFIRMAQGSATVSMLTTVAIVKDMPGLDCHPLYLFLAIGWGAMCGSWMNDSGFWVVSRLGGLTQTQTLKSWTVLLICISIFGIVTTYLISKILPFA